MVDLREPWSIGLVQIPTRLVLAPMAGVSVQAFRRQGRRFGAGLVCSEMVSSAGIEHRNERTLGYLRVASDEHPLAIQLFGSDPFAMAESARMIEAAGADLVDLNFGCPVRKVTKTGAGATLLDDPEHAARIVASIADAVDIPVTVKLRRGMPGKLAPPVDDIGSWAAPTELAGLNHSLVYSFVGATETVARGVQSFLKMTQADELIVSGHIFDHSARLHSYELAARIRDTMS